MKRFRLQKRTIFTSVAIFVAFVVWVTIVAPFLLRIPSDFRYEADIVSVDNFFDEETQSFSGAQNSVTRFRYEASDEANGVLNVKNVFDVRTIAGEKIFSVERVYGIDSISGKHTP